MAYIFYFKSLFVFLFNLFFDNLVSINSVLMQEDLYVF